jgi:hypothetical protein
MGTWSIEGGTEEYTGFLYFEDDNLTLTLYFSVSGTTPFEILARTDPRLMPFAPPINRRCMDKQKRQGTLHSSIARN